MLERIRNHLQATVFEIFGVVTSGGREYAVLTGDHASLSPDGRLLNIWLDDGGGVTLYLLYITEIRTAVDAEGATS